MAPSEVTVRSSPSSLIMRLNLLVSISFAAASLAVSPLSGQTLYVLDNSSSHVTFTGRALKQSIKGKSKKLRGGLIVRGLDMRTAHGDVRFAVSSLETDPDAARGALGDVFGVASYPEVVFYLDSTSLAAASPVVHVHGRLAMHGQVRPVRFAGSARASGGGALLVAEGKTLIDMRDWGMTPPRGFLGLVRMSPQLSLAFRAEFRQPKGTRRTVIALTGGSTK